MEKYKEVSNSVSSDYTSLCYNIDQNQKIPFLSFLKLIFSLKIIYFGQK